MEQAKSWLVLGEVTQDNLGALLHVPEEACPTPGPGSRPQSGQQSQAGGKFPLAFCPGVLDGICASLGGQGLGVQGTTEQLGSHEKLARGPPRPLSSILPHCPDTKLVFCSGRQREEEG